MCLTCGCMLPYERHGDKRNLIVDDIQDSTRTTVGKDLTPGMAVENLKKTWDEKVEEEVKNKKVS